MKKPTCKSKKWNRIHIHNLNRRKGFNGTSKNKDGRRGNEKIDTHPSSTIICPEDFSLSSNFEGVVEVLDKIRQQSKRERNERVYIDFRSIRNLSPSATLVLAAELDRWNKLPKRGRLNAVDVDEWDNHVRDRFSDMGFFDLLQINNPPAENKSGNIRYVKFRTGQKADGEVIENLRSADLEPVIGKIPGKHHLYAAVTEAMTNVVHHAYETDRYKTQKSWWLSASCDSDKHEVTIMIYDQGLGIPKTLPRKFGEKIKNILVTDHAKMIQVAHDLSRSKSGEAYRGYGLERDVRGYLEKLDCQGHYRVVSLCGEYIFRKKLDGNTNETKSHNRTLRGTLIEWRLFLND